MDKVFKEMNEAMVSYMVNSTRQVVELNQKLWQDYIELTTDMVSKTPVLNNLAQTAKK